LRAVVVELAAVERGGALAQARDIHATAPGALDSPAHDAHTNTAHTQTGLTHMRHTFTHTHTHARVHPQHPQHPPHPQHTQPLFADDL
jgi:hypothetical protein